MFDTIVHGCFIYLKGAEKKSVKSCMDFYTISSFIIVVFEKSIERNMFIIFTCVTLPDNA